MSSLQRLPDPLDKASQTKQDNACKSNTIWGGGPITMLTQPGPEPSARLPRPALLLFLEDCMCHHKGATARFTSA